MKAFMATVRIVINPTNSEVTSQDEALDWMSGLLSENEQVLDWSYIKQGDDYTHPQQIDVPDNYVEGDAFN